MIDINWRFLNIKVTIVNIMAAFVLKGSRHICKSLSLVFIKVVTADLNI
jgi:intracellular septation protein A